MVRVIPRTMTAEGLMIHPGTGRAATWQQTGLQSTLNDTSMGIPSGQT